MLKEFHWVLENQVFVKKNMLEGLCKMFSWNASDWMKFAIRDIFLTVFIIIIGKWDVLPFFVGVVIGDAILVILHLAKDSLEK